MPIVRKLQGDAINEDISVSSLLRKAKVIATKLDLKDALVWIDRELDGYMGLSTEELPSYRRLTGDLEAFNPYRGWQPVHFHNTETARVCSQAPIAPAIEVLEKDLKDGCEGCFEFNLPPEIKSHLISILKTPTDVRLKLSYGEIYNIVCTVRNLILDWSLELEKAGILGDDMEFSQEDKREAAPVTQHFFAQNIGVVGNVTDQAHVTNHQSAAIGVDLDLTAVKDFVKQARQALSLIPETMRNQLESTVLSLDEELAEDKPNEAKLRKLLQSAKSICEGAAGNLAAQGIIGLLKGLFTS